MANSIITNKARSKMAKARAGVAPIPKIVGMAFGDGGVDAESNPTLPNMDSLNHEILRKDIDGYMEVTETCYRYSATLSKTEIPKANINELGLYDADGDMVALKSFRNKVKDEDMVMIFEMDDQF